jgi:hypothetical protein
MYTYSFTYFINFFNKTNGQTCAKKSTVSNILKRREYNQHSIVGSVLDNGLNIYLASRKIVVLL